MHKEETITTLGAATIDAFLWSGAFRRMRSAFFPGGVGECFALGAKLDIEEFVLTTGGGATNAAATFAHLGFRARCIAAVGDDALAHTVFEDCRRHHIDTKGIVPLPKEHTAFSSILVMPSGERTVLVARGASQKLTASHVPWQHVTGSWLYMTALAGHTNLLHAALHHAREKEMQVFWNPGLQDLHRVRSWKKEVQAGITVLQLNREEAEVYVGKRYTDIKELLFAVQKTHIPYILVTDGKKGAWCITRDGIWWVKPTGAKAKNRTGAGDAFGSGFLAGFIHTGSVEEALKIGTINAESVVQHIGAKTGVLHAWPTVAHTQRVRVISLS